MAREIKFRAWEKTGSGGMYDNIQNEMFNGFIHNSDFEVMQFTGLKDKKRKEIYEGDIVILHPALEEDTMREGGRRYVVEYNAPYWMLASEAGAFSRSQGGKGWWENQIEVIGNIYENLELLK